MYIPASEIDRLTPVVKEKFVQWDGFMHRRLKFHMADSLFHAAPHCERVLLYALILGEDIFREKTDLLDILAHASVFHDTRRHDDDLDTGHGARAALYYEQFCRDNRDIEFHPESAYLMRYHDLDDSVGIEAIRKRFGEESDRVLTLYAIFKDADALDRWRLGSHGLDPSFLRTDPAKHMTLYSLRIVCATTSPEMLDIMK